MFGHGHGVCRGGGVAVNTCLDPWSGGRRGVRRLVGVSEMSDAEWFAAMEYQAPSTRGVSLV